MNWDGSGRLQHHLGGMGLPLDAVDLIAADFDELAAAEDAFARVLAGLAAALSALDCDLRASLAEWDGDAAGAYQAAHDQWRRAAQDMAARLAALRTVIGVARQNYDGALAANLRTWGVA
jgi:WXG100 family type VII secretion target